MERAEQWSSAASPPSILRLHTVLPQTLSSCIPAVSAQALFEKLEHTTVFVDLPNVSHTKCSILKKQSKHDSEVNSLPRTQPTASILKHTTHESQSEQTNRLSHLVPVTFSSSVTDLSSKRHGILKKRSSLDESKIIRRRSCSPDVSLTKNNCSEFKPILKHQRRSSLDENIKRAQSPDLYPTSILKHNGPKENDGECHSLGSSEPQGILKRKSWTTACEANITCSATVPTSGQKLIAGGPELVDVTEVRPILKKKHSREEALSNETIHIEPRPILKKKSSFESEETDERPKKTILKSLPKYSQDNSSTESAPYSPRKLSALKVRMTPSTSMESLQDRDSVRPILKQNNSHISLRSQLSCDKDDYTSRGKIELAKSDHSFSRKRAQSIEHIRGRNRADERLRILGKCRSLESIYLNDVKRENLACPRVPIGKLNLKQDFIPSRYEECLNALPSTALKLPNRS